jgi:hypothetical protein
LFENDKSPCAPMPRYVMLGLEPSCLMGLLDSIIFIIRISVKYLIYLLKNRLLYEVGVTYRPRPLPLVATTLITQNKFYTVLFNFYYLIPTF